MWPLLPFVILPIVEIALFIQVGGAIGLLPTLGLVILSSVLGVAVLRRRGATAARDVQRAMQEFRDPTAPMAHGALVMLAGLLMIVPGLFTSGVGLLLLIPGVRSSGVVIEMVLPAAVVARHRMGAGGTSTSTSSSPRTSPRLEESGKDMSASLRV